MSQNKTTTREPVFLERDTVEGSCPRCGEGSLRRYPVNSEGGWFMVVKCQDCLWSVSREPWSRLGPIQLLSDSL
jgi:hypothetical protein